MKIYAELIGNYKN